MGTPELDSPIASSQATVLAMRQIAKGRGVEEAVASAKASHLDSGVIRSTYASFVKDAHGKPTGTEREHADAWLNFKRS